MEQKTGLMGGLARALNTGGSALVTAYDAGSAFFTGAYKSVKEAAIKLPVEVKNTVSGGISKVLPREKAKLESEIREYEKKMQKLYYEIGEESSKYADMTKAYEGETVKNLFSMVKEYESEIDKIKKHLAGLEEEEKIREEQKKILKEKKKEAAGEQIPASLKSVISDAVKQGRFDTDTDRAIFERVAGCLLSDDPGLRFLSIAELGKIGNKAAVPVLFEAVKFDNPYLTAEITNSLISIGDPSAVAFFKDKIADKDFWVRQRSLMGLYKFSSVDSIPLIIDALKDGHAEIRLAAAVFLGWKCVAEAVPALNESLKDSDARVKKAVIAALANIGDIAAFPELICVLSDKDKGVREKALDALKSIVGQDLEFDMNAGGRELSKEIERIKNWWDAKRSKFSAAPEGGAEIVELSPDKQQ